MKQGPWSVQCKCRRLKDSIRVLNRGERVCLNLHFDDFEELKRRVLTDTRLIEADVVIPLINVFRLYAEYRNATLLKDPNPYLGKLIAEWRSVRPILLGRGLKCTFPISEISQDEHVQWNIGINGTQV